jgi:hypothetical protein
VTERCLGVETRELPSSVQALMVTEAAVPASPVFLDRDDGHRRG